MSPPDAIKESPGRRGLSQVRAPLTSALAAVGIAALLGGVALLGWALDLPVLRSVIPGAVEMKANAALCIVAISAALFMTGRRGSGALSWPARALAAFVGAIAVATLCEYVFGQDFGIDEWLFRDSGVAFNHAKGRMSPYSAVALMALACATLGSARKSLRPLVRVMAGVAVAIGFVSFLGYLWNATEIISDQVVPPVAIPSAWAFMLLGAAAWLMSLPATSAVRRSRPRLETLVLGGFIPTVFVVIAGGGLIYKSGVNFARSAARIAHTQEVRAALGRLHGAIADAESAQTHHVLVGDSAFESEFILKVRKARESTATLRTLVADSPPQLLLVDELTGLVEARIQELEGTSDVLGAQGREAAVTSLVSDARKNRMQQIRNMSGRMDAAETELLSDRLQRAEQQRQATLVSLLVTLAVLTALFMLLFRGIQREMRARGTVEHDLHQLNTVLEQRVGERTAALAFQQAFLRRVIDLNPSLIFAKDRQGRFVLANRAMAEALGTTAEALIGKSEKDFIADAEEATRYLEGDLEVIQTGRDLVIDRDTMTIASGEVRWFSTVKRPIVSPDGTVTMVLGVCVDITERKAAEDEVRQLAADLERRVEHRTLELHEASAQLEKARLQAESASRAKSAFLANMSHEIRTPMNAIIGLTHLMLRDTLEPLLRARLGNVGDAAHHLLQVNDVLDLSKIEAGKLKLDDTEFSLEAVLSRAMEMVSVRARDQGLELIVHPGRRDLPDRLRGDPLRLAQILINLLSNAVKFTQQGWVSLRCNLLSEEGERLLVRFEIEDTGPGISEEGQAELFNAFEQADVSAVRQHGGTGLGLALSRELATAMGGHAGVISAPGAGSTFWFTAWLGRGAEAEEPLAWSGMPNLRALVVDDLPQAQGAMDECLRALGLEVDVMSSGDEALRAVEAGAQYDVMLIDWQMEPIDGIQTLKQVRSLLAQAAPPSVLLSARDDPELLEQAMDAGYAAIIYKPITAATLRSTLNNVLGRPDATPSASIVDVSDPESLLRQRHAGQRVLLAEDNPINREVAKELLRSAGLVVDTASDGLEAVAMTLSTSYDLVMMDVQMPHMDGLEATLAIRARAAQAMPIIAMTANAFLEDRQACVEVGMNDHVAKPVDPSVLYTTLLRWLPPATPGGGSHDGPLDGPQESSQSQSLDRAPALATLGDRLAAIDGLDIGVALRNVGGRVALLERVMRRFVRIYAQGVPVLLDADSDEQEGRLAWREACHSATGALLTIGAMPLAHAAGDIERGLDARLPRADLRPRGLQLHEGIVVLAGRIAAELDNA